MSVQKQLSQLKEYHHAYLFISSDKTLRHNTAIKFGCQIIGIKESESANHPDFTILNPDIQKYGIDLIKNLAPKTALKPYEAAHKVFIIEEADKLNDQAQNALLKTLEEPAGNSIFILTSNSNDAMLPTITSRCQVFLLEETASEIINTKDPLELETIATQPLLNQFQWIEQNYKNNDLDTQLHIWLKRMHQKLIDLVMDEKNNADSQKIENIIHNSILLQTVIKIKKTTNANVQLLLENLFFNLK